MNLEYDADECLIFPEVSGEQVIRYRQQLKMTQAEFSREFDIPLGTLRRWEQDQNVPSKSRLQLLEMKVRQLGSGAI